MAWNGSSPAENTVEAKRKPICVPVWLWMAMGVIAVVAGVGWLVSPSETDEVRVMPGKIKHNAARYAKSPQEAVRAAMPAKETGKTKKTRRRSPRASFDLFAHLQGEDRKLAEKVQAGLDADNLNATVRAAMAALQSSNAEVRMNAVEALGWFGADALPELTGCMVDPDENVRQSAQNQWEQALQEIEKPGEQFDIVAAAFATLPGEDALTSLGGILSNAAIEMIDGADDADRAAANRLKVLQSLVDIIEGNNAENAQAAKEAYNTITGNEWMGVEEAERYLQDPDNYDPDGPSGADEEAATAPMAADETDAPTDDGTAEMGVGSVEDSEGRASAEPAPEENAAADQTVVDE